MHYFPRMSIKSILWDYSYANLVMLMSSIPSYDPDKQRKKEVADMEIKSIAELNALNL